MNRLQKLLKCLLSKLNVTSRLALNNIALRHQLIILKRGCNKPPILNRDRLFWMLFSRVWSNWKDSLIIVKPQTVVAWHRKGFKLFWKYKSHSKNPGKREQFRLSIESKVDNPESTIETFNRQFQLGKVEKEAVTWAWPLEAGDTMFNVVNTYTRAAQFEGLTAEASYRLQQIGGNILGMLN